MRARRLRLPLLCAALVALAIPACRKTIFDIVTHERIVSVPRSSRSTFTIDTGRIQLPASLGTDKTVDSSTLDLTAQNFNEANAVTVDLSIADAEQPGLFRPVVTFDLAPGETREIRVVHTQPEEALVRATQTESINIRFVSTSAAPGIGEIEFRFTVRVLAHKATPGTGAGSLLFY
jgi:hypothetical protein